MYLKEEQEREVQVRRLRKRTLPKYWKRNSQSIRVVEPSFLIYDHRLMSAESVVYMSWHRVDSTVSSKNSDVDFMTEDSWEVDDYIRNFQIVISESF